MLTKEEKFFDQSKVIRFELLEYNLKRFALYKEHKGSLKIHLNTKKQANGGKLESENATWEIVNAEFRSLLFLIEMKSLIVSGELRLFCADGLKYYFYLFVLLTQRTGNSCSCPEMFLQHVQDIPLSQLEIKTISCLEDAVHLVVGLL